jgi:cell division protein FtsI (penicillin-binding protein 3)
MRHLMRLNVEKGTATRADVKGYHVGGKTGTPRRCRARALPKTKVLTALPRDAGGPAAFSAADMLDEPRGHRRVTASRPRDGMRCRSGGRVIGRVAPLLGLEPRYELATSDKLILAGIKESR